ncbi:hypothetical protein TNCV_2708771 [Trichonephila clavipes]|nr:hypothetical protein TNCV_2708771 [Trichonephila clavipes]
MVRQPCPRHSMYFQCVPFRIAMDGNEMADSLAKSAIADTLRGKRSRWCNQLNIPWKQQNQNFSSGHIKSLTFQQSRKVFPESHWCKAD